MEVLHDKYYTIITDSDVTGELFSPNAHKVMLDYRDMEFIRRMMNQAKQLELVETEFDMNKFMDNICVDLYNFKLSKGLVVKAQNYYF